LRPVGGHPTRMSVTTGHPKTGSAATPSAHRRRREVGVTLIAGGFALAVYGILQVLLLEGPRPYDPSKYFETAVDFPDVPRDLFTQRIGLIAAVRVAVLAFGPSEAALYAVPIASGLLLAAAVYGIVIVLFGDRVAAAGAALVMVLNPSYLVNSSFIFPDNTAVATFTAGFFFLVLGGARADAHGSRGASLAAVCGGVLFGWTYLVRDFSPILVPVVVVAIVLLRYPARRAVLLGATALATASLELVYGFVRYGDPLSHLHDVFDRTPKSHVQGELDGVADVFLVFPRLLVSWHTGWAILLLFALFVVALATLRDRRLWLVGAWCFSFWAFMTAVGLASLPSGRWILNVSSVRYWYPLFPPLVMGAFGGVVLMVRAWVPGSVVDHVRRALVPVLAAIVIVPGVAEFEQCSELDVWPNDPAQRWHELRSWLGTPDAQRYAVIWTDVKTRRLVPAFATTTFGDPLWNGHVKAFPARGRRVVPPADVPRSLILVHKDRFRPGAPEDTAWLQTLRGEWSPLFTTADGRMVVLAHEPPRRVFATVGDWWTVSMPRKPMASHCGARPGIPLPRGAHSK
jgi:hypothetical protein